MIEDVTVAYFIIAVFVLEGVALVVLCFLVRELYQENRRTWNFLGDLHRQVEFLTARKKLADKIAPLPPARNE